MRPRIAAPALVLTLLFAGSASANLIQNGRPQAPATASSLPVARS